MLERQSFQASSCQLRYANAYWRRANASASDWLTPSQTTRGRGEVALLAELINSVARRERVDAGHIALVDATVMIIAFFRRVALLPGQ